MMAQHAARLYLPRRSADWLKIKTVQRSEVVIAGYTRPRGTRSHFGALVVGLYRDQQLHYVAHVRSGFNEKTLDKIYKLMQPLKTNQSPYIVIPKTNQPA